MAGGVSSVEVVKDGATGLEKLVLREAHGCSVQVYLYGGQVIFWENEYREQLLFVSRKVFRSFNVRFEFRLRVALSPTGDLMLTSRIKNTNADGKPFKFGFSYNTYFSVSDISEVRVEGLETLDYIDNLQCGKRCTEQGDAVVFESEAEKVYLSAPPKIVIIDHDKKRTFELRKEGLPDVVVWNPWDRKAKTILDFGEEEYKCMLCVGAANAEKPITLRPGEEWQGRQEISVVPSSYSSGQWDPEIIHRI
uniref:glucose-6-phosphate 1-epimerase n=1 Tax=Oryza meridionalis TaxID=40149 RepID=A0A0E0CGJ6_9ORYZ